MIANVLIYILAAVGVVVYIYISMLGSKVNRLESDLEASNVAVQVSVKNKDTELFEKEQEVEFRKEKEGVYEEDDSGDFVTGKHTINF